MKIPIKLLLILPLLLCVHSCGTDEIIEQQGVENDNFNRSGVIVAIENLESTRLENKMQWVSYMTVQVLLRSEGARSQFEEELNNSSTFNSVQIENLISGDWHIDALFRNEFKNEFIYQYNINLGNINDPCNGGGRPNGRLKPPGSIGGSSDEALYQDYVTYLLEDCLEFYLPNGYESLMTDQSKLNIISSTAHPMINAISNEGFNHQSACLVSTTTIDDNTTNLTVMVRPFRNTTNCTYYDYLINFVDFLD